MIIYIRYCRVAHNPTTTTPTTDEDSSHRQHADPNRATLSVEKSRTIWFRGDANANRSGSRTKLFPMGCALRIVDDLMRMIHVTNRSISQSA